MQRSCSLTPSPPEFRIVEEKIDAFQVAAPPPSIIPLPRKAAPDLEVLRRMEILGQPALPAVAPALRLLLPHFSPS